MDNDLVSIVMPTRNHGGYILQAIQSVLDQTFQNWELVIVDDASDDDSQAIIEACVQKDTRIRAFHNETPLKRSGLVRNIGIAEIKGRYLAFLDADDVWLSDKLERQLTFMRDHEAVFCTTYIHVTDLDGQMIRAYCPDLNTINWDDMLAECYVSTSSTILDRANIHDIHFSAYQYCQDFACWMTLLKQGHVIHMMPHVTTLYRINPRFHLFKKASRLFYRWHIHYFYLKRPFLLSLKDCVFYALAGFRKHYLMRRRP